MWSYIHLYFVSAHCIRGYPKHILNNTLQNINNWYENITLLYLNVNIFIIFFPRQKHVFCARKSQFVIDFIYFFMNKDIYLTIQFVV